MKVLMVLLFLCAGVFAEKLISEDDVGYLITKFVKGNLTKREYEPFKDLIEVLHRQQRITEKPLYPYTEARMAMDCVLCRSILAAAFETITEGQTLEEIITAISTLCTIIGIESYAVCEGAVRLNLPIIKYIVENQPAATPGTICGFLLQSSYIPNNAMCPYDDDRFDWVVELPPVSTVAPVVRHEPPLTVAIMTDFHIDPLYEPYGQTDCDEPVCCRSGQKPRSWENEVFDEAPILNQTVVKNGKTVKIDLDMAPKLREMRICAELRGSVPKLSEPAGFWGDYRDCNTPLWAFDDAIDRIAETHKDIDVVYYIGDNIDYFVWKTTYESIKEVHSYVMDKMRWSFGENVLILPVIGNHDSQPLNQWLVFDPLDAKKHLDWLIAELYKAEQVGESVHILSHIPPGIEDLTHTWTREYNRIINRFSSIIKAEFNGHTHADEFKLFYDSDGEPNHVAWGAGGVTTLSYFNLNYKIAHFDGQKYEPQGITNYIYNLTEANMTPYRRPCWFQLYDMKTTFNLPDLSPASINRLVHNMVTTEKHLLDIYSTFFSKLSVSQMSECFDECKLDMVCNIVVTVLWERERCKELSRLFYLNRKGSRRT